MVLNALNGGRRVEYFVLLMITDGSINDFELTKQQIIKAARLPLSIIMVGVGGADFKGLVIYLVVGEI